jgi:hypothetical protein
VKHEDIFEAARIAAFTRVKTCCEDVENKLCSNDEWRGNLGAFAAQVEQRAIQHCIDFIRNGSFFSDDSPPKRFANEVTAEMEKQLLSRSYPQPFFQERADHSFDPLLVGDAISAEGTSTEDPGVIKQRVRYGDLQGEQDE